MLKLISKIIIVLSVLIIFAGCSEDKKVSTLPTSHPESWMDKESIDFHGSVVLGRGFESCIVCHGVDFDGGESKISCIDCHLAEGACVSCHGGRDNQTGAPPVGLEGETATSDLAVGAHTAHLQSSISSPLVCQNCHIVPASILDTLHLDLHTDSTDNIAEITFSDFPEFADIVWNRDSATCTDSYCHGNFAGGNASNNPVWNGANQASCGSCHDVGTAPASLGWKHEFHVGTANMNCGECHGSVVNDSLVFIDIALHLNGLIDTLVIDTAFCNTCHGAGGGCTTCHGGTDNQSGAPPVGLEGETTTTDLAVGAHSIHLDGGTQADGFSCSSCHVVPASFSDFGHMDGDNIAELTWSGISGGSSSWTRGSAECNNTYCHGNFTGGNASNNPVWNGSNQASCGSCHDVGTAPASLGWKHEFHVTTAGISCNKCHENVVDGSNNITSLDLHVNGLVDTLVIDTAFCNTCHGSGGGCTTCHGGTDNQSGAPPVGLEGETTTTDLAVGAHSIHLDGGTQADGFSCSSCHVVPANFSDLGHMDGDDVAELTWGGISGVSSNWARGSAECNNTYCHGNFAGGNASNNPVWNGANQASCGSCHDVGTAPANLGWKHEFHVTTAGISCNKCHENVVDGSNNITSLDLHVNGIIDTLVIDTAFCNSCHGSGGSGCTLCHGGTDNQSGAPPVGLEGETITTDLAVGAHSIHLDGGTQADGFSCSSCHVVPSSFSDLGHMDGDNIAELTWSGISGGSSSWTRGSAECNNTYCHGNFTGGNAGNNPVWNGSNQASCGSCHDVGTAPANLGWKHDVHVRVFNLECQDCHSTVVDGSNNITSLDLHVNGIVDTMTLDTTTCGLCHSTNQPSCDGCHGGIDNSTGAPPRGIEGELLTTDLAVGAHTTHVAGGTISDGVDCTECHLVPSFFGDPGHYDTDSTAELTWGPLSGASSTWNRTARTCADSYCHGNFSGGFNYTPNWTSSNQANCGSCHDVYGELNSMSGEHKKHVVDENIECSTCHSTVVNSARVIIGLDLHINGSNEVSITTGGNPIYNGTDCSGIGCHGKENW